MYYYHGGNMKCKTCNCEKSETEFYASNKSKCKECTKIAVRKNYREKIDQYKIYEKSRANLPHRVKARQDYAKSIAGINAGNNAKINWMNKHPIQRAANIIVGNAVKNKKLFKPKSCSKCGNETDRLEGHHDDYAFPMSVRWLCSKCHYAWHKFNTPLNGDSD
jgi:ribosomal protein S27AE